MIRRIKHIVSIILFLLLGGFAANGQIAHQYMGSPNSIIVMEGRLGVDSLFVLPYSDTAKINSPLREGSLLYQESDDHIYMFDGYYWQKIIKDADLQGVFQQKVFFHRFVLHDYSNDYFTLPYLPNEDMEMSVLVNGLEQDPQKYSITGQVISLNHKPDHDVIVVNYYSNVQ